MQAFLLAGLLVLSPLVMVHGEEKKPAAAVEKPLPAQPEAILEELQALLTEDDPSDAATSKQIEAFWKKKLVRIDALIAHFRKQFPESPLRWNVALWEVNSWDVREMMGFPRPAGSRPSAEVYAEIMAAAEASPETRATASGDRLSALSEQVMDKKFPLAEWEKALAEHLTKFPDYSQNVMLQEQRVGFVRDLESKRLAAVLEELAKNGNAEVAEMAQLQLAVVKEREALKTKALELKFDASGGTPFDLEKLRGKVVLVQFWASWCTPCINELPHLVALHKKNRERGLEIVGISLDEDEKEFKAALKKRKVEWPQHFDGQGWATPLAKRFGIDQIPTLWLVNKQGMVVDFSAGEDLDEKIEKLLAE